MDCLRKKARAAARNCFQYTCTPHFLMDCLRKKAHATTIFFKFDISLAHFWKLKTFWTLKPFRNAASNILGLETYEFSSISRRHTCCENDLLEDRQKRCGGANQNARIFLPPPQRGRMNTSFAALSEIYNFCTLLHRSNLRI